MRTAVFQLTLHAPWCNSLKDKRSEVRSLQSRLQKRFNISICESGEQDVHRIIEFTIAALVPDAAAADSVQEQIQTFLEGNSEAELIGVQRELY